MFERILPPRIDNVYRGHRFAIWLLLLVLVVKTGIALGTIFNGRNAAQLADGIPLDSFSSAGAQAVITMFAAWGLAQLIWSVFGILALTRYRAMIPLMFVLLLVEHLARRLIFVLEPIARVGAPSGPYINLALITLMTVGMVLALMQRPLKPG